MPVLIQVREQGFAASTPWQQRKYQFVDCAHVVGMRLDGNCGVWLDMSRPGESHQLAVTPDPDQSIYFLLRAVDRIAYCRLQGGTWMIGHDCADYTSIAATGFPLP